MKNIYLATFGMNAGLDNRNDVLLRNLDRYQDYFTKIFVCDGNLTKEAQSYYDSLKNVEVEDYPWDDSYVARYRKNADKVPENEWMLFLDSDEIPSQELNDFFKSNELEQIEKLGVNTVVLPCVLHLRDKEAYYAAENKPPKEFEGQWVKNILVKRDEHLDFKHIGSHVIPNHGAKEKGHYISCPYFHMKSLESFVYNDVWQAFLHPEGQHFSAVDSRLFRLFTKQYKTTVDFKKSTKNGTWPPPLKKFAWERRAQTGNPVSRLAWVYWILEGHDMPEGDDFMKWDIVKKFVLDKEKIGTMNSNIEKDLKIDIS